MPAQTILMEFREGSEHAVLLKHFNHLSQKVLQDAAILYMMCPGRICRKNRKRFNPTSLDSYPGTRIGRRQTRERLYRESD
jgi:hypothetical protein